MNTLPIPHFWEALTMGAQTPLCRGVFIGSNGSGCLITAAVRACGERVETTEEVRDAAFRLWPWLKGGPAPITQRRFLPGTSVGTSFRDLDCPGYGLASACPTSWLMVHYDGNLAPIDWIIAQIRDLEEYVIQDKQAYLDSVNQDPGPVADGRDCSAPVFSEVANAAI